MATMYRPLTVIVDPVARAVVRDTLRLSTRVHELLAAKAPPLPTAPLVPARKLHKLKRRYR